MMGSMNDQHDQMEYFRSALIQFNQQLGASMRDMQKRHDRISPHWQDDMHKEYDRQWEPLHDIMKRYLSHDGPKYVEFLSIKLYALERYLHG